MILGLTFLTGHTGAQAVWKGRFDNPAQTQRTDTSIPEPKGASAGAFAMAEVAKHSDARSCWSAIDGQVYDLTDWIGKHPGGAAVIKAICGRDGSSAFNGQHAGQKRPADFLAGYLIGALN
jgi:cytochrome b involved in lipid metabolism